MSKKANSNKLVWVDDSILVANKPADLLTVPDGYNQLDGCLKQTLETEYGNLWTVHRLDRGTSGAILFARSAEVHRKLNFLFSERRITKIYHVLVEGNPGWERKVIDLPLKLNGDRGHRTVVDNYEGKKSRTDCQVLERFGSVAFIQAIPGTGRRHQIRVHLASVGYPVVVDNLYGSGQPVYLSSIKPGYKKGSGGERPLLKRLGLHAWALEFRHPITQEQLFFKAPYPKDFRVALKQCRKHGL